MRSFMLGLLLSAGGCSPCHVDALDRVVLRFAVADPEALRDAEATACFAGADGQPERCASGSIGIGYSGALRFEPSPYPLGAAAVEVAVPDPEDRGALELHWDWENSSTALKDGDSYRVSVRDAQGNVLVEGARAVSYGKEDDALECGAPDVRAEASL